MDTNADATTLADQDLQELKNLKTSIEQVRRELGKVIVGQDDVINQLLIAIFSRGHCLLEGVPGLAKTLMVSTLARSLQLKFRRIQFTPDLMPSDITGTDVLQEDKSTGARELRFLEGPIFGNIVLADEINRTPPKTQAALLEAMQEKQVTIGGKRYPLPSPFFVLATQNPIEQEGTYTLPEAQQDRFMFKVLVDYPKYDEEYAIADQTTTDYDPVVEEVLAADAINTFQQLVRKVPVPPHTIHYVLRLVRATRIDEGETPDFIQDWLSWGAGTRAVQNLILAGKASAVMDGRSFVTTDDIKALAKPVLRHRIVTTFNAESQGITADHVVEKLIESISDRGDNDEVAPQLARAFE